MVLGEQLFDRLQSKLNGALALCVLSETQFPRVFIVQGVCPQKIAKESFERRLLKPFYGIDVFSRLKIRRYASMHTQVVSVHVCREGHGLKAIDEQFVHVLGTELLKDFGAESEMFSHGSALVVSPQHNHLLRELDFHCVQEDEHFEREEAAIDVVSQKEKIDVWRASPWIDNLFEHMYHIKILAVNVSDDYYRLVHLQNVWFVFEDFRDIFHELHNQLLVNSAF